MRFATPLVPGRLIRRYMRFLSDVELDSGGTVKAHCPNPGSMLGMKHAGLRVWLEPNDDPKKKLDWGWRLAEPESGLIVIDTGLANRVVAEALVARQIHELAEAGAPRPEVKYGKNSRIDFLLGEETYVEVKSVTLSRRPGIAEFPDSVTDRGRKHLEELSDIAAAGKRAVMLFLVNRADAQQVTLADDIDPAYAAAFRAARAAGVETLCYRADISIDQITCGCRLPFEFS